MNIYLYLTILFAIINCTSRSKDECLSITCLDQRDTVSKKIGELKTRFLISSTKDTISNFDIRSSCGCEYAIWNKEMKIYPGHPDTVIIISSIKAHSGTWLKQTTISAGHCTQSFNTGLWFITE